MTNGAKMTPAIDPEPPVPLASRLSFPRLWFTAIAAWVVFGLLLLLRSSNSEITYVLFVASAIPLIAVIRRRWFKKWLFVAEVRLLAWERWLNIASIVLEAAILLPILVHTLTGALGIHFNGIALLLLVIYIWPVSIGILCFNLVLQFITDVWNIRWTAVAILVHLPLLVTIFQ